MSGTARLKQRIFMNEEKAEHALGAIGALMTAHMTSDVGIGVEANFITLSVTAEDFADRVTRALAAALFCAPVDWVEDILLLVEQRQILGSRIDPLVNDKCPARLATD